MLIIFEGIDNSGKTTLSKRFLDYLNTDDGKAEVLRYEFKKGIKEVSDFTWTKEPQFTTEEADMLNSGQLKDEYRREALFFSDHIRHLKELSEGNKVCDRYVWTGLAYAKKFSENCFPFVKYLYPDTSIFPAPDLYIFVDTPVEVCDLRDPTVGIERLRSIRDAYMEVKRFFLQHSPIITISAEYGVEESLELLIDRFKLLASAYNG